MAAAAVLAREPWRLAVGGLLYVVSDSVLAFDLFVRPLPFAELAVWPSYWAGQLLLALGVLAAGASPVVPRPAAVASAGAAR
jgi:uncharacterized membrane protein YhhN